MAFWKFPNVTRCELDDQLFLNVFKLDYNWFCTLFHIHAGIQYIPLIKDAQHCRRSLDKTFFASMAFILFVVFSKRTILIVCASIISCSFAHLYVIIRLVGAQPCGYCLYCRTAGAKTAPPESSWEAKCERIRFHLVKARMSSSRLCPFALAAEGWCGELAEQVRTWEGDIYHPRDWRAVTLSAWKSCGQGPRKEKGKKKSLAIVLQHWLNGSYMWTG